MDYIAHIRNKTYNEKQLLIEHLKNVAELSERFALCLNLSDYAGIIGMLHDIGKYSDKFQQRINGAEISVDHSTCGVQEAFKKRLLMAAFCIAGHHGGIPDIGGTADTKDDSTLSGRLKKNTENYSAWVNEVDQSKFSVLLNLLPKTECHTLLFCAFYFRVWLMLIILTLKILCQTELFQEKVVTD